MTEPTSAAAGAYAGALITTEHGAAWRVTGTTRDVAQRVRDECALQRFELNTIDRQGAPQ